jgi:hypothetical protein
MIISSFQNRNKNTGLPDETRDLYKLALNEIYITLNHYIMEEDGYCSCPKEKKCKFPGAHPIAYHGRPMDPLKNLYRIQSYDELDDTDYDIAIYPSLSNILVLKLNADVYIPCLENTEETPEFVNEYGDYFLIYRCPKNVNIEGKLITIDGYDIEVIYENTVTLNPDCEWEFSIDNKIQDLPSEILALIEK